MMNDMNYFKTTLFLVVLTFGCTIFAFGQNANLPEPRQEKLLNGLKLLIWNEPRAEKVTVKLRIHNGSAFDPKDKMGVMALLADILFPTEQAKEYFSEELEGSLDITSNYDYIQITASGKPSEIQAILETLAQAVTNLQITQENFAIVRDARLAKIQELEKKPSYVADQAIARRLFGDFFPYGRSQEGTTESLKKIDRFDLVTARDKFFTADNATLAIAGNLKPDFVYRATRQLFGAWKKAESKTPATFRQPDAPDGKMFSIEMPNTETYASRLAINAAARNDRDYFATQILTKIWQNQFCLSDETRNGKSRYEPHLLRGVYIVSRNSTNSDGVDVLPGTRNPCSLMLLKDGKIIYPAINQNDFEQAKTKVLAELQQKTQTLSGVADLWLDVDTFKLISVKDEMSKTGSVTLADVQRVAEKLQKEPMVSVVVKKPDTAKQ
jgi:predicted Zn-dependent peptidase